LSLRELWEIEGQRQAEREGAMGGPAGREAEGFGKTVAIKVHDRRSWRWPQNPAGGPFRDGLSHKGSDRPGSLPGRSPQAAAFKGLCPFVQIAKIWRKSCIYLVRSRFANALSGAEREKAKTMMNLNEIKITPRDDQVLRLLVQGCSNKEIALHLNISPRTVKQHLRTLFLRAGIRDGRKRVKLATAMFQKEEMKSCSQEIT
jgi:DNA-binding CsgD family transcriptional regulator